MSFKFHVSGGVVKTGSDARGLRGLKRKLIRAKIRRAFPLGESTTLLQRLAFRSYDRDVVENSPWHMMVMMWSMLMVRYRVLL